MSQQTFKPGDVVRVTSPPADAEWEVLGERQGYPGMLFCRQKVGGVTMPHYPANLELVRPAGSPGDAP